MRQDGKTSTELDDSNEKWNGYDTRKRQGRRLGAVVAVALVSGLGLAHGQVEYVDPSIGCVGHLLEPTRPTVSLPNSMVRVYPVRRDGTDDRISSFPLTIISHRLGELFWLLPTESEPEAQAWHRPLAYDQEKLTPYYYSAHLDDSSIGIEFTPSARCGFFRLTFPSGKPGVLLANRQDGELEAGEDNSFTGIERFNKMQAFVYGEFNAPVKFEVTRDGAKSRMTVQLAESGSSPAAGEARPAGSAGVPPASPNATGKAEKKKPAPVKSALNTSEQGRVLEFRYGISFISADQAKKNLRAEIPSWDFDGTKQRARNSWNATLGQVKVEGGTPAQRRVFYTALYRCCERMVSISEDSQYYSGFDHNVHQDSRRFYVDNWLWDTYRALEPLQTLLRPEMQADKLQSYVRMYEQSGWMPSFAVLWGDYACMTGNHAAAWMADAWFKGVHNFDLEKAYEGLRKNSLDATLLPWRNGPKCSLDDFYNEHGYFPALQPDEKETVAQVNPFERRQAVSVTLEQSYDDWCIAQLARVLHKEEDYQLFLKRAANYKNVYRADKGFVWPKDASGNWIEPFDPQFSGGQGGRDYTTENNAYTYNWDVQHDIRGMAELMGGIPAAQSKLDQLFRTDLGRSKFEFFAVFPDSTGLVGQFSMANEPSMAIPYMYNHLGAPWKAQKRIRQLLDCWFTDTALGIPGDEDGGGMSAFVVFSMLGFYPVVPGLPVYELGSPVFNSVSIRLHNGKVLRVVCKNNSPENKYIRSVSIDGKPQNRVWFRHADVVKGATIELEMGDRPNLKLGADEGSFPPSSIEVDPTTLR
jgi:predicted alpha-1,2-mannosidase